MFVISNKNNIYLSPLKMHVSGSLIHSMIIDNYVIGVNEIS